MEEKGIKKRDLPCVKLLVNIVEKSLDNNPESMTTIEGGYIQPPSIRNRRRHSLKRVEESCKKGLFFPKNAIAVEKAKANKDKMDKLK